MSRAWQGWLFGFIGVAIFATSLPVSRIAVSGLDPAFVGIGRSALAGGLAAIVLLCLDRSLPTREEMALIFLAGLGIVLGFPFFTALAMVELPASHGGVVLGLLPLGTAAAASLFAGERPSAAFWAIGAFGSALVVIFALWESGWLLKLADVWLLAAVVAASCGYAFSGKLTRTRPAWWVISWVLVLLLPVTGFITWFSRPVGAVETDVLLAFTWGAIMPQFIGFFAWNRGLALGGIARIGQVQLLQVFMTLGFAALLLDEGLSVRTLAFAMGVVVTVLIGRKTRIS